MKKTYLLLLGLFIAMVFTVSSAEAISYDYAEIPRGGEYEQWVYFAEPDTNPGDFGYMKSITAINNITVGSEFTFDMWISDVPTGRDGLLAWSIDMNRGSEIVSYTTGNIEQIESGMSVNECSSYAGEYGFGGTTIPPYAPDGDIPLARITWNCHANGTASIIPLAHYGSTGNDFYMWRDFSTLDSVGYQGIGAVPEPASLMLLSTCLMWLVGSNYRRRKA